MKIYLPFLISLLMASSVFAAPVCSSIFSDSGRRLVLIEGVPLESRAKLERQVLEARAFYENVFGQVPGDIKIVVDGPTALRTGYNFKEDNLQFPHLEQVRNNGLDSPDVVRHELFHLFTCRKFPALCPPDLGTREHLQKVHEALADYFAYKIQPGVHFGEGYYANRPFVREYQPDLLLGLTHGAHAEANVLVRHLIQDGVSLEQIREFLESHPGEADLQNLKGLSPKLKQSLQKEMSYEMIAVVTNKPESKLQRYRLSPGESLKIRFSPNENLKRDYADVRVKFQREDGSESAAFLIQGDGLNFELSLKPGGRAEKLLAIFTSGGKTLGAKAFYVGPQLK